MTAKQIPNAVLATFTAILVTIFFAMDVHRHVLKRVLCTVVCTVVSILCSDMDTITRASTFLFGFIN